MSSESPLHVRAVQPGDSPSLIQLFDAEDVPCFCQYWQFSGDHRQWQDRCANGRATSRDALEADLQARRLSGVVALTGDRVVGWARLESPQGMSKHYDSRLLRGLAVLEDSKVVPTMALACYLVAREWRRQGIAQALLDEAIREARRRGMVRLEAFPRGAQDVTDEEQWLGPEALYLAAGFERIVDFAPYPVYRLAL